MEMISLTPERKAQLEQRHGQDSAAALDDVLATYLEWERQDYREAVAGIREGYADFKAGRTQPVRLLISKSGQENNEPHNPV